MAIVRPPCESKSMFIYLLRDLPHVRGFTPNNNTFVFLTRGKNTGLQDFFAGEKCIQKEDTDRPRRRSPSPCKELKEAEMLQKPTGSARCDWTSLTVHLKPEF